MEQNGIVVPTEIDLSGFKSGSQEVKRALDGLFNSFKRVSDGLEEVMSHSAEKGVNVIARVINELREQMDSIRSWGASSLPANEFLILDSILKDFETGDEFRSFEELFQQLKQALPPVIEEMTLVEEKTNKFATAMMSATKQAGKFVIWVGQKLVGAFNALIHSTKKSGDGIEGTFKKLLRPITSFFGRLKGMFTRRLFYGIFSGIREGIQNLASYSKEAQASISSLKSALGLLKNSLATAFAPILNVIAPIIKSFCNMLARAISYVSQFISALTGKNTYIRAKEYVDSYTSSTKGATKATKDLEKQLAGFDDLEILQDSSKGGGGGGGGGGASVGDMFETVPIDNEILNFADRIKEAFENGDFEAIGESIADLLNKAIQEINWSGLGKKLAELINKAVSLVGGFLSTFDVREAGHAIIDFLWSTISNLDALKLGQAFGDLIKGAINLAIGLTDDNNISTLITKIFDKINEFIIGMDISGILQALGQLIKNIITDLPNILVSVLSGIGNLVQTLALAIFGAPEDYTPYKTQIEQEAEDLITNIYAKADEHASLIDTIMGDYEQAQEYVDLLTQLNDKEDKTIEDKAEMERLVGLLNEIYPDLNLQLDDEQSTLSMTNDELLEYIENQRNIMLQQAYHERQKEILKEQYDLWKSNRDITKKVREEQEKLAGYKGLNQQYGDLSKIINETIKKYGGETKSIKLSGEQALAYKDILEDLGYKYDETTGTIEVSVDALGQLQDAMKTNEEKIKNTEDSISSLNGQIEENQGVIDGLTTEYNDLEEAIKTGKSVLDIANDTMEDVPQATEKAQEGVEDYTEAIETATDTTNEATKKIPEDFKKIASGIKNTDIKSKAEEVGKQATIGIGTGMNNKHAVDTMLSNAKSIANKLLNRVKSTLQIQSPSKVFADEVGYMIPLGIGEGMEDGEGKMLKTASNIANALVDEMADKSYDIGMVAGDSLEDGLGAFADKVTNTFENLARRLEAITDRITYREPAIASGIIPYSLQEGAVRANSTQQEELQKAVINAIAGASTAIVRAISENNNVTVSVDNEALSESVIAEINRRTRQLGTSPLLI